MKVSLPAGKYITALAVLLFLILTSSCSQQAGLSAAVPRPEPGSEVRDSRTISAHELHRLLSDRFGRVFIKLSDAAYTLPDKQQVAQLSRMGEKEGWDSADYAIAAMVPLRNYAFGAMYTNGGQGSRRVINVFVTRSREIVFWEARNCTSYHGRLEKPELIVF